MDQRWASGQVGGVMGLPISPHVPMHSLLELLYELESASVDRVDVHGPVDHVAVVVELILGNEHAGEALPVQHLQDLLLVRATGLLDRAGDNISDIVPVCRVAIGFA